MTYYLKIVMVMQTYRGHVDYKNMFYSYRNPDFYKDLCFITITASNIQYMPQSA